MTRNESDEITTNTGSGENDEQEEFSTRYDSAVTTAIILTRHPNPFLHRISSLISDLDDAAMTFGDLLAVGLTPLNEQIIENVLAGFVYPLLLEPLVMCLGGRGKRGTKILKGALRGLWGLLRTFKGPWIQRALLAV